LQVQQCVIQQLALLSSLVTAKPERHPSQNAGTAPCRLAWFADPMRRHSGNDPPDAAQRTGRARMSGIKPPERVRQFGDTDRRMIANPLQ
jgi:hypothetical protein